MVKTLLCILTHIDRDLAERYIELRMTSSGQRNRSKRELCTFLGLLRISRSSPASMILIRLAQTSTRPALTVTFLQQLLRGSEAAHI